MNYPKESDFMTDKSSSAENTLSNTLANELLIEVNKAKIATASILTEIVMKDINKNSIAAVDKVLHTKIGKDYLSAADNGTLEKQAGMVPSIASTGRTRRAFWKGRADPWAHVDPKKFPQGKKKMILLTVSLAGFIGPLSTTIYYPALETIQRDLDTTETLVNATLSMFTFFMAFFPLIWASFSDRYGRRNLYLISFIIYILGSIGCALSNNIALLIIFRGISAAGVSSTMSLGAGTLADIFYPEERGAAFAWYTCGPLLGPAVGPIIGGYIDQAWGYHGIFWFLAAFSAIVLFLMFVFLPETWRRVHNLPAPGEKENHKKSVNPFASLELLKFPNMRVLVVYVAFVFMFMYLNNTAFTRTYTLQYGLSAGQVGLCYLAQAAGSILGGITGGKCSDRVYKETVARNGGVGWPEMRLGGIFMWVGVVVMALAFAAYGWTVQENAHWAWGLLCQFVLGFSLMSPNIVINTYLADCFKSRSASATACNNFVRYITAGVGALVASVLVDKLGNGVLYSICGGILLAAAPLLFIVYWNGRKWSALREAL
ncbi:hypothetical protein BC937DRAFT_86956 [Endogone sp. FLAS-F59071]|nr:hypothetical protein BC937DRAFT_86956 [Endogone sp. FLAS-F59071]|eukprot:RUS19762.1 hypothetical protein BC937DRAFT_86956 [Endogone sp. FLAS-F59071]